MSEQYPNLRAMVEEYSTRAGKGRLILIAVIVVLGLVAAASKGALTLPFIAVTLLIVLFFKKLEGILNRSTRPWDDFLASIKGTPREQQLAELEDELAGESIEWSRVRLTDNFLLWPASIAQGQFTHLEDITLMYYGAIESRVVAQMGHHFMCDTRYAGERLTVSTDSDESEEILREIEARRPAAPLRDVPLPPSSEL